MSHQRPDALAKSFCPNGRRQQRDFQHFSQSEFHARGCIIHQRHGFFFARVDDFHRHAFIAEIKGIGHIVSKIVELNVLLDERFHSSFQSHHLEGLRQEQQGNCISCFYSKGFGRIHKVKQIWKTIGSSSANFDAGTSVPVVDSIMKKIRKISTSSLANGKDTTVNMVRFFHGGRRILNDVIHIDFLCNIVSNLNL